MFSDVGGFFSDAPSDVAPIARTLVGYMPEDAGLIAVAGYGCIADAVKAIRGYGLADKDEFDGALDDLGTHYLLNPSKLSDYRKAGLDTSSGFVAGLYGTNLIFVAAVADNGAFADWFDNLVNEEYGRPRYTDRTDGPRRIREVHVLGHDLATIVSADGEPALIVMGPQAVKGARGSAEVAAEIVAGKRIAADEALKIAGAFGDAQFGVWSGPGMQIPKWVPKELVSYLGHVLGMVSWGSARVWVGDGGPRIAFRTGFADGSDTSSISGSFGNAAGRIAGAAAGSHVTWLFDASSVEKIVTSGLKPKQLAKYSDLKGKLNQKFLRLSLEDQIIRNLGGISVALYDTSRPVTSSSGDDMLGVLADQDVAVYLPFKRPELADQFFSKLNVLKRFIPDGLAQVQLEDGVLHATLPGIGAHVGYASGLLAVSSASAWDRVSGALRASPGEADGGAVAGPGDSRIVDVVLRSAELAPLLGARYSIVREQVNLFLSKISELRLRVDMVQGGLDGEVSAAVSK